MFHWKCDDDDGDDNDDDDDNDVVGNMCLDYLTFIFDRGRSSPNVLK